LNGIIAHRRLAVAGHVYLLAKVAANAFAIAGSAKHHAAAVTPGQVFSFISTSTSSGYVALAEMA
jgi:hypothetical protein